MVATENLIVLYWIHVIYEVITFFCMGNQRQGSKIVNKIKRYCFNMD